MSTDKPIEPGTATGDARAGEVAVPEGSGPSSPTSPTAPGFYGKVPAVGDFLTRRLPRDFVEPWDAWLQSALSASREQLGEDWLNVYLTSPIWRFVLAPSLCGTSTWAGAIMPSVDRVGRYFPLTVACSAAVTPNPFTIVGSSAGWLAKVETLLLSALEDERFDLDDFDRRVQALGAPDSLASAGAGDMRLDPPPSGAPWRVGLTAADQVGDALPTVLDALAATNYGAYSAWWTAGSERVQPSLVVCSGLPPPMSFGALLGGGWTAWSWHESRRSDSGSDSEPKPPPLDGPPQ